MPLDKEDVWADPMVREALKERPATDIAILDCPKCGKHGYYNQGSHFTCRFCRRTWYVCGEDEPAPKGRPSMRADSLVTLADTAGEEGP